VRECYGGTFTDESPNEESLRNQQEDLWAITIKKNIYICD